HGSTSPHILCVTPTMTHRQRRVTPAVTEIIACRNCFLMALLKTGRNGALTECYDELGNRYQLPVYCLSPPVNMIEEKSELDTIEVPEAPASEGQECQLRLRLSTGRDLRLAVRTSDNVQQMKRRLQTQEGVVATSQRWFFSGRPLTDKMKLEELKISRDYVVQVIVSQPPTTPPLPQNPTPVEN
ncbi:hypothetical protein QQF64_017328, partial [Cirrhinus molitorella]